MGCIRFWKLKTGWLTDIEFFLMTNNFLKFMRPEVIR